MSKNYMEQIAQMLGVEIGEKFEIEDFKDCKFYISKDGLKCNSDEASANYVLSDLITGKHEIRKIPKLKHTGLEDVQEDEWIYPLFNDVLNGMKSSKERKLAIREFSDKKIRDNWERYIVIKKRLAKAASELNTESIDWNDENQMKWYISCDPKDNNNLIVEYIYKGPVDSIYFNTKGATKTAIEIVGKDDLIWMLRDFQPFIGYSEEVVENE